MPALLSKEFDQPMTEHNPLEVLNHALSCGPLHSDHLGSDWSKRQAAAWESYLSIPVPKRKDEEWRFTNVNILKLEPFELVQTFNEQDKAEALKLSAANSDHNASAIFLNNHLIHFNPLAEKLKKQGVVWETLASAIKLHPELIKKYFMIQLGRLGSEKYAALHQAFVTAGTVLYVPKGVKIEEPFIVHHFVKGTNAAIFPHTLVIAEEGCHVFFMEYFHSSDQQPAFCCAVNDLVVAPSAHLDYLAVQLLNEKTIALQLGSTEVQKDSSAKVFHVNLGGAFARVETHSRLVGSGAHSEMLALTVAHDHQEFDQRTLQDHQAPHTWSDLLFKNTLNHQSKTIFKGLIKVEKGAFQTDAYQKNRNLLLSSEAEADSMPGLEIENDDVKCSHGATTSQINEEELFYLNSRGISTAEAKYLIGLGFCENVLERFGHLNINESIRTLVQQKFKKSALVNKSATSIEEIDETNVRSLQGTE